MSHRRQLPGRQVGPHGRARAAIIDNDKPVTNLPPNVLLAQPRDGDRFKAGSDISLVANASDRDGYIKFVEFFEGENCLGIVENPLIPFVDGSVESLPASTKLEIQQLPLYRIVWEDPPAGHYVLTAVATDNRGEQTTSIPVVIGVIESYPVPVATITSGDPVAGEQAVSADVASNTAHFVAARRGANIERPLTVAYRIGGKAENGVDYRELSGFATIKAGEYKERIVIAPIDDEECEGRESVVVKLVPPIRTRNDSGITAFPPYRVGSPDKARVVIEDNDICPDNQPPALVIIFPLDGMVFEAPVDVPLFALAGDVDGEVAEVSFYANSTLIGMAVLVGPDFGRAFYRTAWKDAMAGEHKLTAVAVDDDGATTRSQPVGIEVLAEGDPGVGRVVDEVRHRFRNNFPEAVSIDGERDDWHYSEWLGCLTFKTFPWVYHEEHKWMYILETGGNGHSMFDLNGLEWVWTSESVYPYLYSFKNKEWLYYDAGSKNPRWFYSDRTGWLAVD